ncbi:uncharacterized protein TNCV_2179671 [Trichonephila clavipes]|uniref:Uncharacterized protein n=1 Tax=Trichonephila clavipes TaxID=2585209 RepID=A0A8X6VUJ6_TRICX|nr:uncharacterized protein TNCV_2179671 [Trichonephila clavipes]
MGSKNQTNRKKFTCRNCGGGDRGRVAIYRPFEEVSLSLNRTVTCMVLKANDRRTSCPCHDEFRGPRSDYVRQIRFWQRKPVWRQKELLPLSPLHLMRGYTRKEDGPINIENHQIWRS